MVEFINIIDEVDDGHPAERDWKNHDGITVHRVGYNYVTGINLGETAAEICHHFTGRNPKYPGVARATRGELPYTIMIGKPGLVWQCLPLGDIGHHARRWSLRTIGVAVIGDPRYVELTHEQYWALVDVCSLLSRVLGTSSNEIQGHDERPRSSRHRKACPGRLLDMANLRSEVSMVMRASAETEALRANLVP